MDRWTDQIPDCSSPAPHTCRQETKFHLSQQFDYKNGYALPRQVIVGVGRNPVDVDSVAFHNVEDTVRYDPSLTYGRVKNHGPSEFRPHFVLYDKKTLMFQAFFKQSVFESPTEHFRVRHVNILYFLEDDTITVLEPENSGLVQGRLVRRGKIPKTTLEDFWHWKDLNVGIDVSFYGIVLHIVDCDNFTKEFMESQGMELNQPEDLPVDPYTTERGLKMRQPTNKTQLVDDKLRRFLEFDGKVLRFYVVWDDRESDDCAELTPYVLYYYLSDDTMEVQEVQSKNSGKDPFPLLLRKIKLPKNWKDLPGNSLLNPLL
uniref:DM10 domain-containing protein n=1 Tax=Timema bartmani TaxID=61472 RepID=A0A7R9I7N0_9NEOP|nr:unnamed protein product [Timema bartmani]